MRSQKEVRCGIPLFARMTGRYRPHLSLREGLEQPPFPSRFIVSDRFSPSRVRFAASRPGRLRADPKDALLTRGKGGCGFGPCGRAERFPFGHTGRLEPQPRGAVTRRAVAQRRGEPRGCGRSRTPAGLTRLFGCGLSLILPGRDCRLVAQRFSKRNGACIVRSPPDYTSFGI